MKTREKLLKIGTEEFAKRGYDSVSLNDIVKKVGINKATVYHHFKDKQSLYQKIIQNELSLIHESIEEKLHDGLHVDEMLSIYIDSVLHSLKANPNIIPLALRESANFGSNIDEGVVPFFEKEIQYIKEILNKQNIKEKYRSMDSYALYCFIHGTIFIFYTVQMTSLSVGINEIKGDSEKSLEYISKYIKDILIDALVEKEQI